MECQLAASRGEWALCHQLASETWTGYCEHTVGRHLEIRALNTQIVNSLWHMGRLRELRGRASALLSDPRMGGQPRTRMGLLTYVAYGHLADDSPQRARETLDALRKTQEAAGAPGATFLHVQGSAYVEMYDRRPERAVALLDAFITPARRTPLWHYELMRVSLLAQRGAACLSAAAQCADAAARAGYIAAARSDTRALEREDGDFAGAVATAFRGTLLSLDGPADGAAATLMDAAAHCERRDMMLRAWVLRHRAARLVAGEAGERLQQTALEQIAALGARRPAGFLDMLLPSFA